MSGDKKSIDLSGIEKSDELLFLLGRELHLGGIDGNHNVEAVNAGKGWGLNWDALADSFCYLDSGGIWGTSPKYKFPLTLEINNCAQYRAADEKGFGILESILKDTKAAYLKDGLKFEYVLNN